MFILSLDCVLFFFPPSYVDVVVGGGGGSYRHDWCDIAYFCVRVLFLFVFFCLVSHANRLHHCRNVQVTEEVQELLVFRLIVFFSFFLCCFLAFALHPRPCSLWVAILSSEEEVEVEEEVEEEERETKEKRWPA